MRHRPKPTALKVLQGNPGGRSLNMNEPKPAVRIPEPPEELSPDARKEWNRLTPYLLRMGLISDADRAAFSAYCQSYGRWIEAERYLRDEGEIIVTDKGNLVQNPRLWVSNKAFEQMYKLLADFGLTPSSRSKLQVGAPVEDEMDEFMRRGRKLQGGEGE